MSGPGNPPAGWYPAPERTGNERYWDGTRWTDAYRPVSFAAPSSAAAPVAPPPVGAPWQPAPFGYAAPPRTNGYAIASLVLSLVWIYGIGSILALIFGYKARREINYSNGTQTGQNMATAGIALGWLGVIGAALIIYATIVAVSNTPTSVFDPDTGGINSDPPNGICNPDRFLQDPDC